MALLSKTALRGLYTRWILLQDMDAYHLLWMQGEGLVKKLLSRFLEKGLIHDFEMDDAYSEGMLAVGHSLHKWDPQRGAYSTYVWSCARNALSKFSQDPNRCLPRYEEEDEEYDPELVIELTDILEMYYVEGLNDREIAERLNVARESVTRQRLEDIGQLQSTLG